MDRVIAAATSIVNERYPDAMASFAAGSLIRGDGTAYSDLDLVVVYRRLPNAYRESFRFEQLPVEAFVHDVETLNFFFYHVDRPSGVPALPQMVLEGIEIPEPTSDSQALKRLAASVIAMGPPALTDDDRRRMRYEITDTLDDLRAPRSYDELVATGSVLFKSLANFYFRTNGLWSANGKSIPRKLALANAELANRYSLAFDALVRRGEPEAAIALAEEFLASAGGPLFEGYRLDAPASWRTPA
ncbi:MAG: nucleotidyltransferase protein [Gemmatimonadetes bacterium]|nr:nucleotidyltransferase protein [Gemmatimonadota bacterium]